MAVDFKDIIIVVQALIIVVGIFGLYRSIPPEFVRFLLSVLEKKAEETTQPEDNIAVAEVKRLFEKYLAEPPTPTPVVNNTIIAPPAEPVPGVG